MKRLISISIAFFLVSCSSLKTQKNTEDKLDEQALDYLTIADNYQINKKSQEALKFYLKSSKLYLSKLHYLNYSLVKLKIANVYTERRAFKKAQETIDSVKFYQSEFGLKISMDILGATTRLNLSRKKMATAEQSLLGLIHYYENDFERQSYYQAMYLKYFPKKTIDSGKLLRSYKRLLSLYDAGELRSLNTLIYVGKVLLNNGYEKEVLTSLEKIAHEQEIKALSYDILLYRKSNASDVYRKAQYSKMIKELLKE